MRDSIARWVFGAVVIGCLLFLFLFCGDPDNHHVITNTKTGKRVIYNLTTACREGDTITLGWKNERWIVGKKLPNQ